MKLFRPYLFLLSFLNLLNNSAADFGSGRKIAQIEDSVSLTSKFSSRIRYRADPSPDHGHPPKIPLSPPPSRYWLENITHQGVAPFAQPGYQVFRNVMDFGAKGEASLSIPRFSVDYCLQFPLTLPA
jgi:hypothetical protein